MQSFGTVSINHFNRKKFTKLLKSLFYEDNYKLRILYCNVKVHVVDEYSYEIFKCLSLNKLKPIHSNNNILGI